MGRCRPGRGARTAVSLGLLVLRTAAAAGAEELTKDNFESLVHGSGKSAFVKFLAPW